MRNILEICIFVPSVFVENIFFQHEALPLTWAYLRNVNFWDCKTNLYSKNQ